MLSERTRIILFFRYHYYHQLTITQERYPCSWSLHVIEDKVLVTLKSEFSLTLMRTELAAVLRPLTTCSYRTPMSHEFDGNSLTRTCSTMYYASVVQHISRHASSVIQRTYIVRYFYIQSDRAASLWLRNLAARYAAAKFDTRNCWTWKE